MCLYISDVMVEISQLFKMLVFLLLSVLQIHSCRPLEYYIPLETVPTKQYTSNGHNCGHATPPSAAAPNSYYWYAVRPIIPSHETSVQSPPTRKQTNFHKITPSPTTTDHGHEESTLANRFPEFAEIVEPSTTENVKTTKHKQETRKSDPPEPITECHKICGSYKTWLKALQALEEKEKKKKCKDKKEEVDSSFEENSNEDDQYSRFDDDSTAESVDSVETHDDEEKANHKNNAESCNDDSDHPYEENNFEEEQYLPRRCDKKRREKPKNDKNSQIRKCTKEKSN